MPADRIDKIVGLSKRRGFAYPSSEIYGGPRSSWDFGPLGVELKDNIRRQWWKSCVQGREDVVGLDSAVILAPEVWDASGHVEAFADPVTECASCHRPWRADQLLAEYAARAGEPAPGGLIGLACPSCGAVGSLAEPRATTGLVQATLRREPGAEALGAPGLTPAGPEAPAGLHYLRPESAQGAFVNIANVMASSRRRPPFGIAQVGKAFRNEFATGEFILRMAEFERMEVAYFVRPGTEAQWHEHWLDARWAWYVGLGLPEADLRRTERPVDKLPHNAIRSVDIEYRFRAGGGDWAALEGVANRTDVDLSLHSKHSGADLRYFEQETGERWMPYVISPAAGLDRCALAFLLAAYAEDTAPNAKGVPQTRAVLRLDHRIAPVKAAVLPLSRNPELSPRARRLAASLRENWSVEFDDAGAIGRRYRRQDEIGTPFCVTLDFHSLVDDAVTVRERDSMAQQRVSLDRLTGYLAERLAGC